MATIKWQSGVSLWTDPSNWSTAPGPSDDVIIDASGGYTISLTSAATVPSITINDDGARLTVSGASAPVYR
jgi:hypothetical protein